MNSRHDQHQRFISLNKQQLAWHTYTSPLMLAVADQAGSYGGRYSCNGA
jgi:hypothetical protein